MQQTTVSLTADQRARKVAKVLVSWHGATVSELAAVLNCTQQAVSNKLIGARRFKVDELVRLADYLGADAGLFMRDDLERILGSPKDLIDVGDLPWVTNIQSWVERRVA